MKNIICSLVLLLFTASCIPYNRDPELDATLEKLYPANEQLHVSIAFYRQQTNQLISRLQNLLDQNPKNIGAQEALMQAKRLYSKTTELTEHFESFSTRIVELSGGYNEQHRLVGGSDDYHTEYTLGPEGKESGMAYELAQKLRNYDSFMRTLNPKFPLPKIKALSVEGSAADFANFHFKDTPAIACLTTLASIEWQITHNEYNAVLFLCQQIS